MPCHPCPPWIFFQEHNPHSIINAEGLAMKHDSSVEYCRPQTKGFQWDHLQFFTQRSERSLTIHQLDGGWFSQELRPEIKSSYQGLKSTVQPKVGMSISTQTMLSHLGNSNTARNSQLEKCWAAKGSTKTKDNGHIPDATNDNHQKAVFMEATTQLSLYMIHWPTWVSNAKYYWWQHKYKHKYMHVNEDFLKNKGR